MRNIDYDRIIKVIKANELLLNFANKNDNSIFDFDINKSINIIEEIEKFPINLDLDTKIIITEGNPYLTLIICLYSIINNKKIIINVQNNLVNTNKQICEIIYNAINLNEKKLTEIKGEMSISEMIDNCSNREITVIDSKASYNKYKKYGFYPIYIPLFSIDILYNDTKYEGLVESIFDYCESNIIEISVLENVKIDEYKSQINSIFESKSILLLQDNIDENKIKKVFDRKKVYLNVNPFKNFEVDCLKLLHETE